MPNKGTAPTAILIILILISLSLAGGAFYLFQKEKLKTMALGEELQDVRAKEKITESKLEESKREVAKMEMQLRESKNQVDFLSSELQSEKKLQQDSLAQLEQMKAGLEEQKSEKAQVEEKLNQSQQMLETLQAEFKQLEDKKAELEAKLSSLEEKQSQNVELGTIVVGQKEQSVAESVAAAASGVAPALEGKVLVVNKDYNFAVINLGSKDGVNINDIFSVYNKNKYIGDMKVEKVHESMSAANFLSAEIKDKVREGDKVSIKDK
jgi:DNA repair exonuclease SbcCD ATPase subunit